KSLLLRGRLESQIKMTPEYKIAINRFGEIVGEIEKKFSALIYGNMMFKHLNDEQKKKYFLSLIDKSFRINTIKIFNELMDVILLCDFELL
ncbi:MAG: hypothetical protein ACXAD7_24975, partial [Candidatus Kariarchaeaceae archaeon]